MDEAEYCERVGIMQSGKLLAMDSPATLKAALPGRVYEIETVDLLPALDVLVKLPGVLRGVLDSDVLRVIVQDGVDEAGLRAALVEKGLNVGEVHLTQASMEDVFLMQAGKK
jgi:ABC-2 type transport system ATP-binding protein